MHDSTTIQSRAVPPVTFAQGLALVPSIAGILIPGYAVAQPCYLRRGLRAGVGDVDLTATKVLYPHGRAGIVTAYCPAHGLHGPCTAPSTVQRCARTADQQLPQLAVTALGDRTAMWLRLPLTYWCGIRPEPDRELARRGEWAPLPIVATIAAEWLRVNSSYRYERTDGRYLRLLCV